MGSWSPGPGNGSASISCSNGSLQGRPGRGCWPRSIPPPTWCSTCSQANGVDLRGRRFDDRRAALEALTTWSPPMQLSPITDDFDTARSWLVDYPGAGIEGLVAKGASTVYRPGFRGWQKIKHRTTEEAVIGAVIGPITRPESIVAGRYTDQAALIGIINRLQGWGIELHGSGNSERWTPRHRSSPRQGHRQERAGARLRDPSGRPDRARRRLLPARVQHHRGTPGNSPARHGRRPRRAAPHPGPPRRTGLPPIAIHIDSRRWH